MTTRNDTVAGTDAYNQRVMKAFRAGHGHAAGQRLLLLHHGGARRASSA